MKFRNRIIMGFGAVALLGWLLGAVGLYTIQRLGGMANRQDNLREALVATTDVLGAHYDWRHELTMAVANGQEFTGTTDPNTCALGLWLASEKSKTDDTFLLAYIAEVEEPHAYIHNRAVYVNELIASGDTQEAWRVLEEEILPRTTEAIDLMGKVETRYGEILAEEMAVLHLFKSRIRVLILFLFVATVAASVLLATFITRSIMRPVFEIRDGARQLAQGNLAFSCDYTVDDEIGQLVQAFESLADSMRQQADVLDHLASGDYTSKIPVRSDKDRVNTSINTLIEKTSGVLTNVREASANVTSAAQQMAIASQSLASGSTHQAATVEEFSATLDEVQSEVAANNQLAASTLEDVTQVGSLMKKSRQAMDEMLASMEQINANSSEIRTVIKVIDDMAFQTNILALNAAVEAARAGQHGKGFAVVADEVRGLAAKSAEAAKETSGLIEKSLVSVMEGNTIVGKVNARMKEMSALVEKNGQSLGLISEATDRQQVAIDELNSGMHQISTVVQANSATAEEAAATADGMSAQAKALEESVSHFHLKDTPAKTIAVSRGGAAKDGYGGMLYAE